MKKTLFVVALLIFVGFGVARGGLITAVAQMDANQKIAQLQEQVKLLNATVANQGMRIQALEAKVR